jgi:hypothetical protein
MDEQLEISRRHIYEKKKNEGHKNEDCMEKLPVHSHQQKDIAEKHYFGNESGTRQYTFIIYIHYFKKLFIKLLVGTLIVLVELVKTAKLRHPPAHPLSPTPTN